ncbi:hypothetical protein [Planctomycetes bacterium TBK1r]|uniref:Acylphosphatase-like domain-containing protein n=1 Tax=Stieleria magnilauensis TaxID=2527963 RepID=A0ABX5XYD4_9BACT|nr:hypothetical protein TBK1r_59940 [Planctomycetes bacterium TBK1r]QDV87045.1 hypothetical protein TBK1r_60720 [Planctomycetes bacterium TBK1r]
MSIRKHYGVTFRRLESLGGEFRGVIVRADDNEHACVRVQDYLERMKSETHENMRDEVASIQAEPIGYIGSSEFGERFDGWHQSLLNLQGSYFHISEEALK